MIQRYLLSFILILSIYGTAQDRCTSCVRQYNRIKETVKGDKLGDSMFLLIYHTKGTHYNIADSLSQDFIRTSGVHKNNWIKGKAQLARALIFYDAGKFNEALPYIQTAINYFKERKSTIDLCYSYQLLAGTYDALANWDLAIKTTEQSLKLSLQLDNKTLIGNDYNQFGIMYNKQGHYHKARNYFLKELQIRKELSDTFSIIAVYTNLGNVYAKLSKADSALFFLRKALVHTQETKNDYYSIGHVNNDIGSFFLKTKQYELAEKHLKLSLNARRKISDNWEIGYTLNYLGSLYIEMGNFKESRKYFNEAVQLAKGNGNTKQEYESYELLGKMYASIGKFDSAYFFSERHSFLRDSMIRTQNMLSAEALVANYEFEKKQKEIELLKKRSEIQSLKISRQRFMLFGLFSGIFLLFLSIYYIIRSRNLKIEKLRIESKLKEEKLKKENEQRLNEDRQRISRELHDNIGTNLTMLKAAISGVSMERGTPELNQLAEETIRELRKSVWLLNHKEIELEEWVVKLREYFRYIPNLKIAYRNLNEAELKMESHVLSELFRICQEAVNNALKHAECNQIVMNVEVVNSELIIEIKDDGVGYDESLVEKGSGLMNMKYRIEKIGGKLNCNSRNGGGTKIIASLNLT